ncbi:hypothetical protein D9M70_365300 [compost metagenome]
MVSWLRFRVLAMRLLDMDCSSRSMISSSRLVNSEDSPAAVSVVARGDAGPTLAQFNGTAANRVRKLSRTGSSLQSRFASRASTEGPSSKMVRTRPRR